MTIWNEFQSQSTGAKIAEGIGIAALCVFAPEFIPVVGAELAADAAVVGAAEGATIASEGLLAGAAETAEVGALEVGEASEASLIDESAWVEQGAPDEGTQLLNNNNPSTVRGPSQGSGRPAFTGKIGELAKKGGKIAIQQAGQQLGQSLIQSALQARPTSQEESHAVASDKPPASIQDGNHTSYVQHNYYHQDGRLYDYRHSYMPEQHGCYYPETSQPEAIQSFTGVGDSMIMHSGASRTLYNQTPHVNRNKCEVYTLPLTQENIQDRTQGSDIHPVHHADQAMLHSFHMADTPTEHNLLYNRYLNDEGEVVQASPFPLSMGNTPASAENPYSPFGHANSAASIRGSGISAFHPSALLA